MADTNSFDIVIIGSNFVQLGRAKAKKRKSRREWHEMISHVRNAENGSPQHPTLDC